MIKAFVVENDRLHAVDDIVGRKESLAWIDVLNSSEEEEREFERLTGIELPMLQSVREIEFSSRPYVEKEAICMTVVLPMDIGGGQSSMSPVSFILAEDRLITVRRRDSNGFEALLAEIKQRGAACASGRAIIAGLLETLVDRLAEALEQANRDIGTISRDIFHPINKGRNRRDLRFQTILGQIGHKEELVSSIKGSLIAIRRLTEFFEKSMKPEDAEKSARARLRSTANDIPSLSDRASVLTQQLTFLLDATLGMIGIEQNGIIKIVSVAAVVFLPPTLIASVYGMNFALMPELKWALGYPFALGLIVASAVLPAWVFRRLGWV